VICVVLDLEDSSQRAVDAMQCALEVPGESQTDFGDGGTLSGVFFRATSLHCVGCRTGRKTAGTEKGRPAG
jgi:hypothetical protein